MEKEGVVCEVGTQFFYIIYMKFNLKGSNLEDLCKTIQSRNTTKTGNHCTSD